MSSQRRPVPNLPPELILKVAECLVATEKLVLNTRTSSQASTILSFTRVSRLTYPVALRILYRRCLWIDSSNRLRLLLLSLETHLSPTRSTISTLPAVSLQDCLQTLFLAPYKQSLDDLPVAHWIFELFATARHTLRRLVIDIPLRSLYPEDDHLNVRPKLRAAFEELTSLEEFTSINDELYLTTQEDAWTLNHEIPVWSRWHSLRRLALYNITMDSEDMDFLPTLSNLRSLILVRPDGSGRDAWLSLFGKFTQEYLTISEINDEYVLKRCSELYPLSQQDRTTWELQAHLELAPIGIPQLCTCGGHVQDTDLVKMWVKERVMDGTLWDKDLATAEVTRIQNRILDLRSQDLVGCPMSGLEDLGNEVSPVVCQ